MSVLDEMATELAVHVSVPRPHKSPTRADAIRAALRERYPCGEMPAGAQKALAGEFGLSPGRTWQIVQGFGLTVARKKDHPPALCLCGKPLKTLRSRLCADCQRVTIPCAQCGVAFTVRAAELARRLSQRTPGTGHTAPGAFCSRGCRNVWLGASQNAGRLRDPEVLRRIRESYAKRMASRTTCKHGHPWVDANLYVYTDRQGRASKRCQTCGRERVAAARRAG